jgi:hypothetical protein
MQNNQPILSCAGRDSVNIDTALLQHLLENFTPNLIGAKQRAGLLELDLRLIAKGEYGDDSLKVFKDIITKEFLFIQLMEASRLARQVTAGCEEAPSVEDEL